MIRIKAPTDGETIVHDHVQGDVRFPNKDLDDFIILRSDGTPTYMHAVVVDDHDMGVTHIIRGDDHLTNAARQTIIYKGDGLGRAGDGAHPADPRRRWRQALQAPWRARRRGLSRHGLSAGGAASNYLARLGWSHGDDEIMSLDEHDPLVRARGRQQGRRALRLRRSWRR